MTPGDPSVAEVAAGPGLVIRRGRVVSVAQLGDADVESLVGFVTRLAHRDADSPDDAAGTSDDAIVAFVDALDLAPGAGIAVAVLEGESSIVVRGAVHVGVDDAAGSSSFTGAPTASRRPLPSSLRSLTIGPSGAAAPSPLPYTDLVEGIVPGSAIALRWAPAVATPEASGADGAAEPATPTADPLDDRADNPRSSFVAVSLLGPADDDEPDERPPLPVVAAGSTDAAGDTDAPRASFVAVSLLGPADDDEPDERPPLPVVDPGARRAAVEQSPVPIVSGTACPNRHVNRPGATACVTCALPIAVGAATIDGPRPVLGRLVHDDGRTFPLDFGHVIGRDPTADDRVRAGTVRPLTLADPDSVVSRVHAEVVLDGWDVSVVDHDSANGTHVLPPGSTTWFRLTPGTPHTLSNGERIAVSGQVLVYEQR